MRLRHRKLTPSSERLNFTFDGIRVEALAGETIAAALTAAGRPALRDAGAELGSSDDMRGLYCGMGACFDCVVTVDGRASQRACLTKVAGGETVRSSAPSGTPDDPLRALAASPKRAELPEEAMDVLVVGAGPAGLAAGVVAARAGAKVVLLDERAQSGGQYFKPLAPSQQAVRPIDAQFAAGARLERDAAVAGVDIRQGVQVWGAQAPDEVLALVDGEARVMRPRRLILATGAYERPYPMPGWTLPGVMTTGAAQTLVRAYGVAPGRRVVVAGNGPLNLQLAEELLARGVKVAAIVESAAKPSPRRVAHVMKATAAAPDLMAQGLATLARLRRAGIPTYWGHVAVAALGAGQVEALRFAPVGADGTPDLDAARDIAADAACLGYGFIASSEIARALGCDMRHDRRHLGSLAVATDEDGATSVKGVYAIGDGASVSGARVALARGTLAGAACAHDLGFDAPEGQGARRALARAERFQAALWSLYGAPRASLRHVPDETMLCRCEGLTCGRLRAEIAAGWDGLPTLKRRTRLGMGRCQGRYCVPSASLLLAEMTGQERHDEEGFAPRLPVKPFPAAALAVEKPEWGGHARAGSPNLARPRRVDDVVAREAEIVVIGGGVVGACLAFELAEAGRDVLVVERDDVNLQASGANAGSLHVQLLSFDFGAKAEAGGGPAAATLPLGPYAVRLWQELAERCREDGLGGFEIRITGGLMVAETDKGLDFLRAKAALERRHGVEAEVLSAAELRKLAPNLNPALIGAEYAPQEGKINPLAATYAVFEAARRRGARYLRGADVTAIDRLADGWAVQTSRGAIRAQIVVNAAGPWARQIGAMVGLDVPVYSAPLQMIVTERAPPLVGQLLAHADRHLSLKQLESGGLVVGGAWTATYAGRQRMNTAVRASIEGNLFAARSVLPQVDGLHVLRSWAGMNVNIDGAPIVGEALGRPGFYNAVTSNGYTLAPAIARITAELIAEGRTEHDRPAYRLERFAKAVETTHDHTNERIPA